ncbi:hypothetical protein, partial [Xanthomonas graminis]|uniref:hypothetical protein n=1 Tax=Xanthomonas graminis TaxID=3390026 RepID=UPI001C4A0CB7
MLAWARRRVADNVVECSGHPDRNRFPGSMFHPSRNARGRSAAWTSVAAEAAPARPADNLLDA